MSRGRHLRAPSGRLFGAVTVLVTVALGVASVAPAQAATARSIVSACGWYSEPLLDVRGTNPHHPGISCLFLWDVAAGTSPGRYSPERNVTRAEMATFIARLLTESGEVLPSSPPHRFTDVSPASIHARAINQLAAVDIVGGSGDGSMFRPSAPVSRAQMATFLMGAAALVSGGPLPTGGDAFTDDAGNVHEPNIDRAANAGIAAGTSGSSFSPSGQVTRAQMGSFLARLLALLVDEFGVPTRADGSDPPFGPLYRFIVSPGELGNSQPGRWDPCAAPTIPWRIVGSSEPAWDALVADALADASTATGLQVPRDQGFTGARRIDVEFVPASQLPEGVGGIAQPRIIGTAAGEPEIASGRIIFNRDFVELVMDPAAGPIGVEAANILALHEVAHVFGLDHVDDPRLLMAPELDPDLQDPFYGQGELDGLLLVGATRGCLP
jgi:hypothetical protein